MIPARWMDALRRNAWLAAALGICVGLCLLLGKDAAPATQEERISAVLSAMDGAGPTEIAIFYGAEELPCGALVLSSGADDIALRLQMNRAVSTLLGLDPDDVVVYALEDSDGR